MAVLDRRKHMGEYTGGTSDPRLIRRLDLLPVAARPSTPEQLEAAGAYLDGYVERNNLTPATRSDLRDMIFGKEAA